MTTPVKILILGHGEMGHAMEYLLKARHTLDIWEKFPQSNDTYVNLKDSVPQADIVLFCLPVNPHRTVVQQITPLLKQTGLCISIAKGLDETGKTAAQIFADHLPVHQPHAVLYGPMISEEICADRYAFGQVGCRDFATWQRIQACFAHTKLFVEHTDDITGISWSVILKNVYAMAFGMADELNLGDNMRGYLAAVALQELDQIVRTMGGQPESAYHLAGLGDLITTATSDSSHHHTLGRRLAREETHDISGEGPHTLKMIQQHQLLDPQPYPLFRLIRDLVSHPHQVRTKFHEYLEQVYAQTGKSQCKHG